MDLIKSPNDDDKSKKRTQPIKTTSLWLTEIDDMQNKTSYVNLVCKWASQLGLCDLVVLVTQRRRKDLKSFHVRLRTPLIMWTQEQRAHGNNFVHPFKPPL
jgi:DUF2075 family protein